MLKNKRGQSVLEYVILIIVVIAAFVTLQAYVKRGLQGRIKSATDDIGEQFTTSNGVNYHKTVRSTTSSFENSLAGSTNTTSNTASNTTRSVTLPAANAEYWPS